MQLLPELRKASRQFEGSVSFGTIDCTVHGNLCQRYNIRSYPTTMFFNQSESEPFRGSHTANEIVDFVREMLSPSGKNQILATVHRVLYCDCTHMNSSFSLTLF